MKKIINNRLLIACLLLAISSCGKAIKDKNTAKTDSLQTPAAIQKVVAIAKVLPESGIIELSTDQAGIVAQVYKQAGDTLLAGEPLIRISLNNADLTLKQAEQDYLAQQASTAAEKAQVAVYEAEYKEKKNSLNTTKRLAALGAETAQNVLIQERELAVISGNLASARQQASAAGNKTNALATAAQKSKNQRDDLIIRQSHDALILDLSIKPGEAVNNLQPFANIAHLGPYILEGEIDEMFANRVKMGQQVTVTYVGMSEKIATAEIIELAPILANKSLFYENSSETTDRRVRKFKAKLMGAEGLLINSKVECSINIQ